MIRGLYAIRDNLAGELVGGIFLHANDGAAVRFFTEVATTPNTSVAQHLTDHELVLLGYVDTETSEVALLPEKTKSILTGSAFKASLDQQREASARTVPDEGSSIRHLPDGRRVQDIG